MTINKEALKAHAQRFNIELDAQAIEKFDRYAYLLIEKNKQLNLTAITEPDAIVVKHFADSLSLFSVINPQEKSSLIDVGTGAGFPGVAICIARPDMKVTMIDGTNKKLDFIRSACEELEIKADIIHSRAEEGGHDRKLREKFDYATARAVANLRNLSEYCLPFVIPGGMFIAMKGAKVNDEISEARNAIIYLGGKIERDESFDLGDMGERNLIVVKKISQTPSKYPRPSAQIAKKPLI